MLGIKQVVKVMPSNVRNMLAVTGIAIAALDAMYTIATIDTLNLLVAAVVMFLTVVGTLPALHVPDNVAMLTALVAGIVTAIGILTPWALCSWFPKEPGLCSCMQDDPLAIIKIVLLATAFVAGCIAYAM